MTVDIILISTVINALLVVHYNSKTFHNFTNESKV